MARRRPTEQSALLLNEEPLQVLPSLAVAVGLNEAIILQQLHYWLKRSEHVLDDRPWIYNTYEQWRSQFPFWSADTIKRAMHHLESQEVITTTTRFNRNPIDKTKWYTINYAHLNAVCGSSTGQDAPTTMQIAPSTGQDAPTTMQIAPIDDADCPIDDADCPHSQRLQTETTTEIQDPDLSSVTDEPGVTRRATRPPIRYPPGFLTFWDVYPHARRASKPACLKLWDKAGLEDRTEEICAKITRLSITTWQGREPHFIPMTLTWLNQGRFEDELVDLPPALAAGSAREFRTFEATKRLLEDHDDDAEARSPRVPRRLS
jgi:hypothetical protein